MEYAIIRKCLLFIVMKCAIIRIILLYCTATLFILRQNSHEFPTTSMSYIGTSRSNLVNFVKIKL